MGQYFDMRGQAVTLGPRLGSGGEGAVFEMLGADRQVAKLYHRPVSREQADKLRRMVELVCPEVTKFAAWPLATIHQGGRRGPMVGIVMPRVTGFSPIHMLYSPAHRKLKFPDKDWSFLVHVAANCAAAFDSIHAQSHVIGDVNQGNVLVSPQGTVFLIDCDSFQVTAQDKVFLCQVGVSHFTPPELHGLSLGKVRRTVNHDCFGLAVLIFHLLFLGRHPFAGRFLGTGDMTIEQAIQEFRFAFSSAAAALQMARPPNTLPIEQIAPSLGALFEQAFGRPSVQPGGRPSANQWFAALRQLGQQLRDCPADEGHKYASVLCDCPWCTIVERKGPNFFGSVTLYRITADALEISDSAQQCWAEIENVTPPLQLRAAPRAVSPPRGSPLPAGLRESRLLMVVVRCLVAVGVLLSAASLGHLPLMFLAILVCLAAGAACAYLETHSPYGKERLRRRRLWLVRKSERNHVAAQWKDTAFHYSTEFEVAHMKLAALYDQLQHLEARYQEDRRQLEGQKAVRQREAFLRSQFLSAAKLEGVGPGWTAWLASYGMETAYDIDARRLAKILGANHLLLDYLLAWRRRVEAEFHFDESQGVPAADLQALVGKYSRLRQDLERALREGLEALRSFTRKARAALNVIDQRATQAEQALAQAEADLSALPF
jgi:DNA-binding helix-hairpin-helix protein with protein kinase domain